jgi:predicted DNA-binding antitoxin AbrB/MazE fold protein
MLGMQLKDYTDRGLQWSILVSPVAAVFRHGVFEPLDPVNLPEEQRVQLRIEPLSMSTPSEWLDQVRELQEAVVRRAGTLPDSSSDIASDRCR